MSTDVDCVPVVTPYLPHGHVVQTTEYEKLFSLVVLVDGITAVDLNLAVGQ
jgi:hypothetical protein